MSNPADLLIDRKFEYLLNRMDFASNGDSLNEAGYHAARTALFEYVGHLQRESVLLKTLRVLLAEGSETK